MHLKVFGSEAGWGLFGWLADWMECLLMFDGWIELLDLYPGKVSEEEWYLGVRRARPT